MVALDSCSCYVSAQNLFPLQFNKAVEKRKRETAFELYVTFLQSVFLLSEWWFVLLLWCHWMGWEHEYHHICKSNIPPHRVFFTPDSQTEIFIFLHFWKLIKNEKLLQQTQKSDPSLDSALCGGTFSFSYSHQSVRTGLYLLWVWGLWGVWGICPQSSSQNCSTSVSRSLLTCW